MNFIALRQKILPYPISSKGLGYFASKYFNQGLRILFDRVIQKIFMLRFHGSNLVNARRRNFQEIAMPRQATLMISIFEEKLWRRVDIATVTPQSLGENRYWSVQTRWSRQSIKCVSREYYRENRGIVLFAVASDSRRKDKFYWTTSRYVRQVMISITWYVSRISGLQ